MLVKYWNFDFSFYLFFVLLKGDEKKEKKEDEEMSGPPLSMPSLLTTKPIPSLLATNITAPQSFLNI